MNKWQERNEPVIQEFRANGGQVNNSTSLILLTTTGAKTGQPRIIPLMHVPYENGVLAVASKGGAEKDPEWYRNIQVHPEVTVEVGNEKYETTAKVLTGEERAKAFARAVEVFAPYADYQKKTAREIPVIYLGRPAR